MPLLDEPFSFNYFGHNITARSLGPITIPDVSKITSVHVVPFTNNGNVVAINVINRGWDIPGGHIDEGELLPLDTLRRETREEANLSILEPVLVDILALECETLDLSAKPYMLLYAAEVWELNTFTPNDEVSQRLLMTAKMFVDSYFGNKTYAKTMIDASISALAPNHPSSVTVAQGKVDSLSASGTAIPKKSTTIKKRLLILAVAAAVLLFNLPLIHMLYVKARLATVSLPLSNQVVSMGSNGLGPSGTNISFALNKSYASTLEAKDDIRTQFQQAGIPIPQPDNKSTITPQGDGVTGGDYINEINMSYFPAGGGHTELTFVLEQAIPCEFASTGGKYAEYQCEGKPVSDTFTDELINSRPIGSVRVHTLVSF